MNKLCLKKRIKRQEYLGVFRQGGNGMFSRISHSGERQRKKNHSNEFSFSSSFRKLLSCCCCFSFLNSTLGPLQPWCQRDSPIKATKEVSNRPKVRLTALTKSFQHFQEVNACLSVAIRTAPGQKKERKMEKIQNYWIFITHKSFLARNNNKKRCSTKSRFKRTSSVIPQKKENFRSLTENTGRHPHRHSHTHTPTHTSHTQTALSTALWVLSVHNMATIIPLVTAEAWGTVRGAWSKKQLEVQSTEATIHRIQGKKAKLNEKMKKNDRNFKVFNWDSMWWTNKK